MKKICSILCAAAIICACCFAVWAAAEMTGTHSYTEREVSCVSGENTLRGTLTIPRDADGSLPVAILLHGLNTTRSWCDDIAWRLAEEGVASVRFDFAGCGESDGAHVDMTVSSLIRDTVSIYDYVCGLPFVDTDNIILVGKSMGCVSALLAEQAYALDVKAMCFWYPGFGIDLTTTAGNLLGVRFDASDPPESLDVWGYEYGREFITEAQSLDLVSAGKGCGEPVLIIHGDSDQVSSITGSYVAEQIMSDCTLDVIEGGGHGFEGEQEQQALDDMVDFVLEHVTTSSSSRQQAASARAAIT